MARRPRIHYSGALYHVILRGNAGHPVFTDDVDRTRFCLLLQEGIERFGCHVYAFSLLDTQAHLALQVNEQPLAKIMQSLLFRYTQWYNRRHGLFGHVFYGRYKANVVDPDNYLLQLVRYIHLNPWRAGVVRRPEEHVWSSHRYYMGSAGAPWLETGTVLRAFGEDEGTARRAYAGFVASGMPKDAEEEFDWEGSDGRVIGSEAFAARVESAARGGARRRVSLEEVVGAVCSVYGRGRDDLARKGKGRRAAEARAVVAMLVQEEGITVTSAARAFGRDTSTLTAGASRLRGRLERDEALRERIEQVRGALPR